MTQKISHTMKEAVSDGVFPDAELLVAKQNETLFHEWYGRARKGICFDIASLTKPICTATLTAMLLAEGLLKISDTLYQWLAGARQVVHRSMTIEMLLNHTAGFPAWQPYYRQLPLSLIGTEEGKQLIYDECLRELIVAPPGEKTIYSDIGYILLAKILEEAGDAPLDVLFLNRIARPLNLHDTFFRRLIGARLEEQSEKDHRRFAPTSDCPWRKRVLHGEVDNENAHALGGVAGHAGLFSTADDIHRFLVEFIACYQGERDWLPSSTLHQLIDFSHVRRHEDSFLGGWNLVTPGRSSSGHFFSEHSIGHLAYTGCSIWVDLDRYAWIVLLTNRVHPSPTNEKIKTFRPTLHDLIMTEMIL